MIKKISAALTAAVILSCAANVMAFIDMPDGAMGEALENAVNNGIMTGYEDSTILPYNKITRAEMAAMITRCTGAEKETDISKYTDVTEGDWFYPVMSKAVAMGAFEGDGEKLNPGDNITFGEVFAVTARVFSLEKAEISVLNEYSDVSSAPDWMKEYAAQIVDGGCWGEGMTELRLTEPINRGEFAQLINNIVSVYVDEPGEFTNTSGGNIMVRANDVTIVSPNGCDRIITGDSVSGVTTIKDCENLKYLVARGGELYPIGSVYSIRLAMPGTVLNASEVKIDHGWGAEGTVVNMGDASL